MNSTSHAPHHIVIVGGGSAGWMSACLLNRHWHELGVKITVIESSEIGVIGVGEGSTPQLKLFFDEIGIDEASWMPACNATYKNGIRFKNWTSKPGFEEYFHPFASKIDAFTAPIFMHNCLIRRKGVEIDAHPDRFYLAARLAEQHLSPKASENFPFEIGYGYHFDSVLLGQFLQKTAIERGVRHIDGKVVEVEQHLNNDIKTLVLADGQRIEGDFFVDCSGFRALLIGDTLNVPFSSFKDNLFNDAAVAIPTPATHVIRSETRSTALNHGWAWDIPLTNRTGNGYVYSSDFCTTEEAETELRSQLGLLDADVEARHLKMKVGRRQHHWQNNVLAVGLSQGFIEPLEATALHFVIETLNHFIADFAGNQFRADKREQYNQKLNNRFEGIRDYIVAHYRLNSRTDTEYWRANGSNNKLSNNLVNMINCWLSGGDLTAQIEAQKLVSFYPPFSWYCIFAGYGIFPKPEQLVAGNAQTHRYDLTDNDEFIRRSALNFPPHTESLQFSRPAVV